MTLVDALWPAPAPASMSRVQAARPCRSDNREELAEEARGSLHLPLDPAALSRQLRELLPLCRCLPGVTRIRPLPGGLGGVGDCGLYEGDDGTGLLKIRAWRPTGRLWLSLDGPRMTLQVDLRWRARDDGSRLDLELQRLGLGSAALPLTAAAFAANLALWLQSAPTAD